MHYVCLYCTIKTAERGAKQNKHGRQFTVLEQYQLTITVRPIVYDVVSLYLGVMWTVDTKFSPDRSVSFGCKTRGLADMISLYNSVFERHTTKAPYSTVNLLNPLNAELKPICYLLALLGAHHFLHVSRIRVKSLTLRLLMSYIYGAPILDVSRSHTTTQHSR